MRLVKKSSTKDIWLAVMLPRLTWETPRPMIPWYKPRGKSPYSDIVCCETQPTLFLSIFRTLAFEDEYENERTLAFLECGKW